MKKIVSTLLTGFALLVHVAVAVPARSAPSDYLRSSSRQATGDVLLTFDEPAYGFQRYDDCLANVNEQMLKSLHRVVDRCFDPCSGDNGCPKNCCMTFLGGEQFLSCESSGSCVRYGVSPTNDIGFYSLEAYMAPPLAGMVTCPLGKLAKGTSSCAVRLQSDGSEKLCASGVEVPQVGQLLDSERCSAADDHKLLTIGDASDSAKNESSSDANQGNAGIDRSNETGNGNVSVSLANDGDASCFPADGVVETETHGRKRMHELVVGDSVHVGDGRFSKVYLFTHKLENGLFEFVRIETASGVILTVSPGHYLPRGDGGLVAAREVSVGDLMFLGSGESTEVRRLSRTMRLGLYNPQTMDGNIVVDDILCSTFTVAFPFPRFAHSVLLKPCRAMFSLFGVRCGTLLEGQSVFGERLRSVWMVTIVSVATKLRLLPAALRRFLEEEGVVNLKQVYRRTN
jgi:Hint module